VGVVSDPAVLRDVPAAFSHDRNHLANLQPTEHQMLVRRTRVISPAPDVLLNTTEPTEEQKHVALANPLFG